MLGLLYPVELVEELLHRTANISSQAGGVVVVCGPDPDGELVGATEEGAGLAHQGGGNLGWVGSVGLGYSHDPRLCAFSSASRSHTRRSPTIPALPHRTRTFPAPGVPGCVTAGLSLDETLRSMREALALHLEGEPHPPVATRLGDHLDLDPTAVAVVEVEVPPSLVEATA